MIRGHPDRHAPTRFYGESATKEGTCGLSRHDLAGQSRLITLRTTTHKGLLCNENCAILFLGTEK